MKKDTKIGLILLAGLILVGLVYVFTSFYGDREDKNPTSNSLSNKNYAYSNKEKEFAGFVQKFDEYGFEVTCPVKLEAAPANIKNKFALNYGGFENKDSREKFTFYQVVVDNLPAGYSRATEAEKREVEDKLFSSYAQAGRIERMQFKGINAVISDFSQNGTTGKGLIFIKDSQIFNFVVITNISLNEKFEQYINSVTFSNRVEKEIVKDKNYYKEQGFQIFEKYHLAVKCPVKFENVATQADMQAYGAIDSQSESLYRISIQDMPAAYTNAPEKRKNEIEDIMLNSLSKEGYNTSQIKFLTYNAIVVDSYLDDAPGKGIAFINKKDARLYIFAVFSVHNLNTKFNKLKNNITFY